MKALISFRYFVSLLFFVFLAGQVRAQRFGHGGGGFSGGGRPAGGNMGGGNMGGGNRGFIGGGRPEPSGMRPSGGMTRPAAPVQAAPPGAVFNGGGSAGRPAGIINGGANAGRPAGTFNGGGSAGRPAGTINGGTQNFGNHNYNSVNRPAANSNDRGAQGHENYNVYHGGGYRMRSYSYHPYHPYIWGPRWHPYGFFLPFLAADAYAFSLANHNYYYDEGVYYEPSDGGYNVVPAPVSAIVSSLPEGYETVPVGDDFYYYYGGTFYVENEQGYQVVQAPYGAVVTRIPEGAQQQSINGQNLLVYNNTYYQPISQDGQDAYQVVQVN